MLGVEVVAGAVKRSAVSFFTVEFTKLSRLLFFVVEFIYSTDFDNIRVHAKISQLIASNYATTLFYTLTHTHTHSYTRRYKKRISLNKH